MNDLEKLKKIGMEHYRKTCTVSQTGEHPIYCPCVRAGHIWAFRKHFIPEFYQNFTLDQFTGEKATKKGKEKLLPPTIVAKAKDALINYCFKGRTSEDEYSEKDWLDNSIIAQRREQGHSLVIYGNPYRIVSTNTGTKEEHKTVKMPIGRTMLACLVLREAINLRWKMGHEGDSYCYENYDQLVQRLLKQSSGDKSYDDPINVYKECDWLVVDGISVRKETEATKRFRNSVLNGLFGERIDAGLPSILVFQDDISKVELEEEFGTFIAQIIRNKNTHKIALV